MDPAERRDQIRRYWETTGNDGDANHEIYHEDAVLEFPQSGERFVGVENFREWRSGYPASTSFGFREIRGRDDLWVAEVTVRYDGGTQNFGVSIIELRGERIARESIYVAEGFEPPEWRARWRAGP